METIRWAIMAVVLGLAVAWAVWGRAPAGPAVPATQATAPANGAAPGSQAPATSGTGKTVLAPDTSSPGAQSGQNATTYRPDAKSQIVVEERLVDLGTVMPDTFHDVEFTLKNPTDKTIRILHLAPGCGCTKAGIESPDIPPGGTQIVKARYTARRERNEDHIRVTALTDEDGGPRFDLQIKSKIRHDIVLEPRVLNYGTLTKGATKTLTFVARHTENKPFTVKGVAAGGNNEFAFTWEPIDGTERAAWKITGVCTPGEKLMTLNDTFALMTDLKGSEALPFTVYAFIQGSLRVMPYAIMMQHGTDGAMRPLVANVKGGPKGKVLRVVKVIETHERAFDYVLDQKGLRNVQLSITFRDKLPTNETTRGSFLIYAEGEETPVQLPYTIMPRPGAGADPITSALEAVKDQLRERPKPAPAPDATPAPPKSP